MLKGTLITMVIIFHISTFLFIECIFSLINNAIISDVKTGCKRHSFGFDKDATATRGRGT
jgi:hypothetical protein